MISKGFNENTVKFKFKFKARQCLFFHPMLYFTYAEVAV